jgi:dihydroorotate dehydrogenase (fumarate)
MADLQTKYMGLNLRNPLIASSSGLTASAEQIIELEKHGIGAVVLKSLFEEQIQMDVDAQRTNNMYGSYSEVENYVGFYTRKHNLSAYLNTIKEAKAKTNIPIIASVNCISSSEWIEFAQKIQEAGADALELNVFILGSDANFSGRAIEQNYFDILAKIKPFVHIPIALKISPYISGLAHFAKELSHSGIASLVLFNRFYRPDIDLENMQLIGSNDVFSYPHENANVLRWLGILKGQVNCDLCASTGLVDAQSVLKNIVTGANAVQIASVLYREGLSVIGKILLEMDTWLDTNRYQNINELIGVLSQQTVTKPMMYERAQFMRYFSDTK